jgi:carboxypeptidase PM20D1
VVRNKKIEVKLLKANEASPVSPTEAAPYLKLKELIHATCPGAVVAPFLVMGGTDSHHYAPVCGNCYRYSPFQFGLDLLLCTHAANERIPVKTIADGVKFFKRYVKRMAGE